jgi:hypothetical protein
MKVPIPLNDLDKTILAFQRSQAALPDLLRHLCMGNLRSAAVLGGVFGHRPGACFPKLAARRRCNPQVRTPAPLLPMTVPQPFQYQGIERALAPLILQYLPISTTRLVEPFCGSATGSPQSNFPQT